MSRQRDMSATPGPTTRSRASASRGTTPQPQARTTVPAVTVGQSFAYGARGKAELKSQVAKGSTSVDSAFEGARNRKSSAKTPSRAPPATEAIDEEDESEDEQLSDQQYATSRPPTASSARLDGSEFDRSHTVVDPAARYGNDRDESPQEPHNIQVAAGTALKFLPAYLWNLILMAIMVAGCLAVGFLCYNGYRTTFTPVVPTEV
ncbi:hypothetical protein KC335_g8753, partial [Hortaea werneckii]